MAASKKKTHPQIDLSNQEEVVRLRKRWPDKLDIQAWWIYFKVHSASMDDLDNPTTIKRWLGELHRLTDMGAHVELYAYCKEFRIEFRQPHEYSNGYSVGIGRTR